MANLSKRKRFSQYLGISHKKAVVVIPGFLSATNAKATETKWVNALKNAGCRDDIYIFQWDSGNLLNLINNIARFWPLLLAGRFMQILLPLMIFKKEVNKAVRNTEVEAPHFAHFVERLVLKYDKLSVYSYSFGTRLYYHACNFLPDSIFEKSITLAGASEKTWKQWRNVAKKSKTHINVYSENDLVLKLLYTLPLLGVGDEPIGIQPLRKKGIRNKNLTSKINGHLDYLPNSKYWY